MTREDKVMQIGHFIEGVEGWHKVSNAFYELFDADIGESALEGMYVGYAEVIWDLIAEENEALENAELFQHCEELFNEIAYDIGTDGFSDISYYVSPEEKKIVRLQTAEDIWNFFTDKDCVIGLFNPENF